MNNPILLNALFAEYQAECAERTMLIDDMKAINRVAELLKYELPKAEEVR